MLELPMLSAALGAFLLLLQQLLMLTVGLHRAKAGIVVGQGDDENLERKIRRHGNLAENAALFLAALTLTEMSRAPREVILGFAAFFAVARVSHAIGFSHLDGSHNAGGNRLFVMARVFGAMGSAFGGIALALYLTYWITTY